MAACEDLVFAEAALERGDAKAAGEAIERHLYQAPDDAHALHVLAKMLMDGGKAAIARLPAMRACELEPGKIDHWIVLAAAELALKRAQGAAVALEAAYRLDPENATLLSLDAHRALLDFNINESAALAEKSLAIQDHFQAHVPLGFARLHQRRWGEGWDHYHYGLGRAQWRVKHDYGLPEWSGQPGKVLVYGEQGLGDQLCYSSALGPEVSIVNCHPKLENLFRRSLGAKVYGDQFEKEYLWPRDADFQINMAGYLKYTRRTAESWPHKAYLKPHPPKQLQWRALLELLGHGLKVGIAWTGGLYNSYGGLGRNLRLEDLTALYDLPVHCVSLEYRSPNLDIRRFHQSTKVRITHFDWATETEDLDDAVAMIANLDAVVSVPTCSVHIAGALGIPAYVIAHDQPHFWHGLNDDTSAVWGPGVKYFRRPKLGHQGAIDAAIKALAQDFGL